MNPQDKRPGKKVSSKREDPESIAGKRPDERKPPADAERTESEPAARVEADAAGSAADRSHQPVTNQDEQDKITNAEEGNLPAIEK